MEAHSSKFCSELVQFNTLLNFLMFLNENRVFAGGQGAKVQTSQLFEFPRTASREAPCSDQVSALSALISRSICTSRTNPHTIHTNCKL